MCVLKKEILFWKTRCEDQLPEDYNWSHAMLRQFTFLYCLHNLWFSFSEDFYTIKCQQIWWNERKKKFSVEKSIHFPNVLEVALEIWCSWANSLSVISSTSSEIQSSGNNLTPNSEKCSTSACSVQLDEKSIQVTSASFRAGNPRVGYPQGVPNEAH